MFKRSKRKRPSVNEIELKRRRLAVATEETFRTLYNLDNGGTIDPGDFPLLVSFVVQLVEKNGDTFTTSELKKEIAVEACERLVDNLYETYKEESRDILKSQINYTIENMIDTSLSQVYLNLRGKALRMFRNKELEEAQKKIDDCDDSPY